MRKVFLTSLVCLVLCISCRKDDGDTGIYGQWKLVSVTDKSAGTIHEKPAGAVGDIKLKFTAFGLTGQTLRNSIVNGKYTFQNGTDLVIETYGSTLVMEDEWGSMFLSVLSSCGLQSIHPCTPLKVTFQGQTMKIVSPLRYDLLMTRD